jgi:TonB family protein
VVAHLLLWPLGQIVSRRAGSGRVVPTDGVMEVQLVDPREADREDNPAEPPEQLVDLDYLDKQELPEDAKYVSEFDNNPDEERRAPRQRPIPGSQPHGDRPDAEEQPARPKSPDKEKVGMALPLGGREANPGDADQSSPGDAAEQSEDAERSEASKRPPTLSPRGARGLPDSLRKEWGSPGTHDALEDELEEGPGNMLKTKRWMYASFFNRVRNGVAQHWHPEVVHAANDPDGRIYGTKTRKTRLLISLNPDGSLHKVRLDASSNVDYLDEEAIRAVRQAAPFTNPPPGLVDDGSGHIEFGFAFIFEIHGGRRIFRYRN